MPNQTVLMMKQKENDEKKKIVMLYAHNNTQTLSKNKIYTLFGCEWNRLSESTKIEHRRPKSMREFFYAIVVAIGFNLQILKWEYTKRKKKKKNSNGSAATAFEHKNCKKWLMMQVIFQFLLNISKKLEVNEQMK